MNGFFAVGIVMLVICLVVFFPFAVIWALNTLFSLEIAYTFWTWLAMVVINIWTLGKFNYKN